MRFRGFASRRLVRRGSQVCKSKLSFEQDCWSSVSKGAIACVRSLLDKDPAKRPTPAAVLAQPWLCGDAPANPMQHTVVNRFKAFSSASKMKRIVMKNLVHTLTADELQGLKKLFDSFDRNKDKKLTLDELWKGLNQSGARVKQAEIKELMATVDMDSSGSIDYEEFIAVLVHKVKLCTEENLRQMFREIDTDGSGQLQRPELLAVLLKNEGMTPRTSMSALNAEVQALIEECDTDHDGSINYSEFLVAMRRGARSVMRAEHMNS